MTRLPVQPNESRPVISVNLEELKFWLSIMQEHALFIKAGLPANRKEAIQEAQDFYRCFGSLYAKAAEISSEKKLKELIRQSKEKVEDFFRFKRRLLQLALRGELCGCLFPSMLDHMSREAEYFLRLLESMSDCKTFRLWPKTKELSFWIRLMSDHSDFIRQKLDPSEVILIESTEGFINEFDGLFRQSLDFSSMLRGANCNIPSFGRFLQDTRAANMRLRDFERALHCMLEEKKVLGLLTPLFADHVRRESDHFLMVSAMLENDIQTSGYTGGSLTASMAEEGCAETIADIGSADCGVQANITAANTANNLAAEAKLAALKQKSAQAACPSAAEAAPSQLNTMLDSEVLEEIDDDETVAKSAVLPASTANLAPKSKYAWNTAWPRPLTEDK